MTEISRAPEATLIGRLTQRIAELESQLRQRDTLITARQEEKRQLREQLDEAQRAGKRQATPLARQKRVEHPKRPGRKRGQGRFSYRRPPAPTAVRETKVAPLVCCPACGGPVRARAGNTSSTWWTFPWWKR